MTANRIATDPLTTTSAQTIRPGELRSARLGRRQLCWLVILITVLDVALIGPLIGRGSLHLLDFGDYPEGPHPPLPLSVYGFPPGIASRAPVDALLYWIFQEFHWELLHLLPFAAVAPLTCIGFARMFRGQGQAIGIATLFFTVNPFVYERMASGQVYVVMGYSLLPALLALAVRPFRSLLATVTLGGLIFALSAALSVHYLFIDGLLLLILVLAHLGLRQSRVIKACVGIGMSGFALNLYWLIPATHAIRTMQSHVTGVDLSVFQTAADPTWGLAVNIAGLYGFWRPGPPLVKDQISGWPFVLLAVLLVVGAGLWELWVRGGSAGRALALSCAVTAVAGGLLAAGTQGPTGVLYMWLFDHLPGFKVMREAGKFSALVALAYAAGFGAGAEAITRQLARNMTRVLCVCCVAAIPLVYGYTELWGFSGYARPSSYPSSWAAADRSMSPGATAIALPWRSYVQIPWSGNRVIANPMQGYFARPTISADDLEAGPIATETYNPRSLFLQFCLSEGNRLTEFGRLLAPLGIRYVILAKVPGAQSYSWLGRQHDLRRVFDAATIAVYQNEEAVPDAYEPGRRITLRDWGQVVALAQRVPLTDYLIRVRDGRPGPLDGVTATIPPPKAPRLIKSAGSSASASESLDLRSPVRAVVLTNPAYPGWQLPGFRATSQFGVTVAFTRSTDLGRQVQLAAAYGPWQLVKVCDIAGACLAAANVVLLMIIVLRRRYRGSQDLRLPLPDIPRPHCPGHD